MKTMLKFVGGIFLIILISPIFTVSFLWHFLVLPGWSIGKGMAEDADDLFEVDSK